MAQSSPTSSASVRKAEFTFSLAGRPKLTFETPSIVRPPRAWMRRRASSVTCAACGSEDTVSVSVSMTTSSGAMPYCAAVSYMRSAQATRPSGVSGMPPSSSARPTTTPPYFCTSGNTAAMLSAFALTEFIIGLPL